MVNLSWKKTRPKVLKKIVYGINETELNKYIAVHEDRGWERGSEIKEHGYGVACLMTFKIE